MPCREEGETFGLHGVATPSKSVRGFDRHIRMFGNLAHQDRVMSPATADDQAVDTGRQRRYRPGDGGSGQRGQQRRPVGK